MQAVFPPWPFLANPRGGLLLYSESPSVARIGSVLWQVDPILRLVDAHLTRSHAGHHLRNGDAPARVLTACPARIGFPWKCFQGEQ